MYSGGAAFLSLDPRYSNFDGFANCRALEQAGDDDSFQNLLRSVVISGAIQKLRVQANSVGQREGLIHRQNVPVPGDREDYGSTIAAMIVVILHNELTVRLGADSALVHGTLHTLSCRGPYHFRIQGVKAGGPIHNLRDREGLFSAGQKWAVGLRN